eukprot:14640580-Alexandrium_andersonii.AAC.1
MCNVLRLNHEELAGKIFLRSRATCNTGFRLSCRMPSAPASTWQGRSPTGGANLGSCWALPCQKTAMRSQRLGQAQKAVARRPTPQAAQ